MKMPDSETELEGRIAKERQRLTGGGIATGVLSVWWDNFSTIDNSQDPADRELNLEGGSFSLCFAGIDVTS